MNASFGRFGLMPFQPISFSLAMTWLLSALLLSSPLSALEFSVHMNNSSRLRAVLAVGTIEVGDTHRMSAFLQRMPYRDNTAIYLASPGGNLYEGIKLGMYFQHQRIKTVIEGGFVCASACALAFLGGTDSTGRPWRSSSTTSGLGFHAFKSINETMSADEVQRTVADILRYGRQVNAPIELLIRGFETPSQTVFWVSHHDICQLGIRLWSNEYNRFLCN